MAYISPEDVRFFLMDRTASENFLLDDLEFTDEEIGNAMVLAVDKYNSTLPLVNTYTSESFPFRYEMMLGASAILLRSKATNMMRNNLNYNTSDGVAINDLERRKEYLGMAQSFDAEFTDRIQKIKVSKNAEECYGYV
jgi:hypothetical protein